MDPIVRTVAKGFQFLEGPRWHGDRLYVSDFYQHKVFAITPSGEQQVVVEVPQQPSGLGFGPDGALYVVSMLDMRVLRVDGGQTTVWADVAAQVDGPINDMVVDREGGAYIGNFGEPADGSRPMQETNIVRVAPDGAVSVAASGINFPNGMVISPDGTLFLVAETFAGRITAFDRAPDGSLSNRRAWMQWGEAPDEVDVPRAMAELPVLPDGLALDAEGGVWVADAKGHGVSRVVAGGKVTDFIDTGEQSVYACALGGHDRRTLFLCVARPLGLEEPSETFNSELLAADVDIPGAGWP